jgi:hypothetical protein
MQLQEVTSGMLINAQHAPAAAIATSHETIKTCNSSATALTVSTDMRLCRQARGNSRAETVAVQMNAQITPMNRWQLVGQCL